MARIYRGPVPHADLPNLDLLTLLFDSEHSLAQDDTVLHAEADNPSNKITKANLRQLSQQIAHGLRQKYGVGAPGPGKDVVTVISYGQMLVPAAFFGVIAAGGVYSAASPSSTMSELARQISIGTSQLIICGSEFKDIAEQSAKQCNVPLERVLVLESSPRWSLTSLDGKINVISDQLLPWKKVTDPVELKHSLITILWSSGTTGLPKGVMLSHQNLVAETVLTALSARTWAAQQVEAGVELAPMEYITVAHLPISHIAGLFGYLIAPQYAGGRVYWMRKYEWKRMLAHVKRYKVTAFYTVPSIFLRISKSPDVTDHFKHLIGAATGAAPMDGDLQKLASSKLGEGETFIGQTWGLSETTGAVTSVPKGEAHVDGSIGSILPTVEIRMVDESFNDVEPGQEGEMLVRSPLVSNGYFNNPQATKDTFHDGWFCTGDIAVRKDGRFFIVDRKKELLKYKGLQIAPAEIENTLFQHPKIKEAAVVGVNSLPDDPASDCPRAYIVANPSEITEEEVKSYVKDRLAPYKQLRGGVVFVDEIPKNAIGKFLRRDLRERAKKELGLPKQKKSAKL